MSFLTDWVSQIIFFIFLATIISLLIPATSHQQVIKLVFGLIIFLLFLHPLTELFGINPENYINSWELTLDEMSSEELENEINSKKNEIQASQDAYILKQLEQDIQNSVEEGLIERFKVQVDQLEIGMKDGSNSDKFYENIQTLTFHLSEINHHQSQIEKVEVVSIPKNSKELNREDEQNITQFLSTRLNVQEDQIHIVWGGSSQ